MRPPRPSLNALRAFEATARLGTMTAAAGELCVTHGAVSQHIRQLEESYGLPLLLRGGRALVPTPEGARLAEGLAAAFSLIDASVDLLRPAPLTLSCSATIMMYWLIPRVARFHAQYPRINLQLNMGYDTLDFIRDKVTVAIRNSLIPPPRDVVIHDLIAEWTGPVCSPELRASADLTSFDALGRTRLLATKTRPDAWEEWIRIVEAKQPLPPASEVYEHFYLLIQAALFGLGVALVPKMLVESELASGRLVAPFGFASGTRRLVLWTAPHLASRPETRALTTWLTQEMKE
jgi:LysR family transcriptional regulator, glycine cleavage system transcriptional activator